MRGAWIEISTNLPIESSFAMSLPMRGAWIEIYIQMKCARPMPSLPMRGAWIEIMRITDATVNELVAPHAGSVD